ncbi:MAG: anti-sigma factor antagonist [Planctomycetaceae bacterium]|nr:anti-sigma factor antagonist [Planctomycetaceae bacterium]
MPVSVVTPEVVVDHRVTVIVLSAGYRSINEQVLDGGFRDFLTETCGRADPPLVVLDLSNTTFFGSSFIELIFRVWNRLQARPGGSFAICGLTSHCLEVLKITHLDTLWRLYPTREEAVEALLVHHPDQPGWGPNPLATGG